MRSKWLNRGPWGSKADAPGVPEASRTPAPSSLSIPGTPSTQVPSKENSMPPAPPSAESTPVIESATFQVELLPMEDIYLAAGILAPRKGYSIKKVVEMLNNEHMSGLSREMKRVAILMALDAAGVPIADVLADAKARQQALDAHEAEQKKRAEAEWVRKAEENTQIEAELERIKAHHQARIARNLDAITREQGVFSQWQAQKKQEAQAMAEAAELCLQAPAAATASASAPTPAAAAPVPVNPATVEPAKAMAKTAGI